MKTLTIAFIFSLERAMTLTERLRNHAAHPAYHPYGPIFAEAAEAIRDRDAEIERLRKAIAQWQSPDYMRLHAGEMTPQDVRNVQAVLTAIERTTRDE